MTLLHGNEPSGVIALHQWLVESRRPAVDILAIVPSVGAAIDGSGFLHRMRPGRQDLNRAFGPPFVGSEGRLAREVLDLIGESGATQVVDLHNNTGHSPSYGVIARCDQAHLDLVSLFSNRCVTSHLRLGALIEALEELTTVTVECGRAGDPLADDVAFTGIRAYFEHSSLDDAPRFDAVRRYEMPLRVQVEGGARIAFGAAPDPGAELTLRSDLDQHNFESIEAGAVVGWTRTLESLTVTDEEERDVTREFFLVDEGALRVRRTVVPAMMTTSLTAARQDCLCYFMREVTD